MTYCIPHGNRVGSAPGGEHICGPCEDGEPPTEGEQMALIEKKCSVCHKFSWDSQTGSYNEEHEVKDRKGNVTGTAKCNTNGATYRDGILVTD